MCGRFARVSPFPVLVEEFGLVGGPLDLAPSFNIPPSSSILAVVNEGGNRLTACRWGLVPSWAKDPSIGSRMINARAETLATKPSFRGPFRHSRCLVVADGFFEWKRTEGGPRIPFFIRRKDRRPMGFAGLFADWQAPTGEPPLRTCTIVTTEANDLLRPVHDRMPVIVPARSRPLWLDRDATDPERLQPLLAPPPSAPLEAYPVSSRVNSPSADEPAVIEPV